MTKPHVVSAITGLPRPHWRGRIHTYAFWFTIPLAAAVVAVAEHPVGRMAAAIYVASLLAVYGVSASYHRLAKTPAAQRLMRRLDHSMIFVLIAGTYTPVCMAALDPARRWPLLGAVWSLAGVGVAAKVWGNDLVMRASNALYIVIGWLAVLVVPALLETLGRSAFVLLVAGGVLYTIGALLFFLRLPDPRPLVFGYHEVWHSFTVLAATSHLVMVALVVA